MGGEEINFLAVPAAILLALAGAPPALRRAGFGWAKVVFGTLTVTVAALGVAGVVTAIQHKTGLSALPLAWLVPSALAGVLYRLSSLPAP